MKLVVVAGDLHVNSTVALSPNRLTLDDGGEFRPSKHQRWINARWAEFWNAAAAEKERLDAECVVILTGELADDLRHASTQLVTKHAGDIVNASLAVLEPVQAVADTLYVTRGSEAHVGQSSSIDEAIARAIGATPDEDGHYARWVFRGAVEGVRIDAAHHPGTGHARPWTRGSDANRLAQMVMAAYIDLGLPLPHLVLRGHNHKPADSADNHRTRAVILPSWQLSNAFGYRISHGSEVLPIGGMLLVVDDGQIVSERKMFWRWPVMPKGWREA